MQTLDIKIVIGLINFVQLKAESGIFFRST